MRHKIMAWMVWCSGLETIVAGILTAAADGPPLAALVLVVGGIGLQVGVILSVAFPPTPTNPPE